MDSQIQDLVDTSREILSQQTRRSRISWPDDFKKKVIEELSRGYSVKYPGQQVFVERQSNLASFWGRRQLKTAS